VSSKRSVVFEVQRSVMVNDGGDDVEPLCVDVVRCLSFSRERIRRDLPPTSKLFWWPALPSCIASCSQLIWMNREREKYL
jgi:hypothetical protein